MKKITFTILFAFTALFSIGQITGGFFYGTDYGGNVYVYFQGTNISQYSIRIEIRSINEQLDQEKSWNCNLSSGDYFTVGPSDGWFWQPGEKLIITYSNGTSYYWVYALQQNYNSYDNFMDRDIMTPAWMDNVPDINNYDQFNSSKSTNRTKAEIDIQIAKLERYLSDARRDYENCSSVVLKPSYYKIIQNYEEKLQELRTERIYAK